MMKKLFRKIKLNNKGLSLVELICAIGIMSLLGASVAGIMVVCSRTFASTTADTDLQQDAQLLVNQISNLIQDATKVTAIDTADGTTLTIEKGAFVYTIYRDGTSGNLLLSDGAETQPLAENVKLFLADANDYLDTGMVQLYVSLENTAHSRDYAGNYTVASRNKEINPDVVESTIQINCETDIILEPLEERDIPIQVTGSTLTAGITVTLNNALDATTSLLLMPAVPGTDPGTYTYKLHVGKNETAPELAILVSSVEKKLDGITPAAQKVIHVYIRRVDDIVLTGTRTGGNDKKNGAVYRLEPTLWGNNIAKLEYRDDDNYEINTPNLIAWDFIYSYEGETKDLKYNSGSKVFENEYLKVEFKNIKTDTLKNVDGSDIANNALITEVVADNYNYSGTDVPYVKITLKKDMSDKGQLYVATTSLHPKGRNKTSTAYVDTPIFDEWKLNVIPFSLSGNSLKRGSDDQIASFDQIGTLKQQLKNNTGIDDSWFEVEKLWRVAEVTSYDTESGNPTSYGPFSQWMYMRENGQSNAINLRPQGGLILDPEKAYKVEIKWQFIKKDTGVVYWPYSYTPKNEYLIDSGVVSPVTIYYKINGNNNVTGASDLPVKAGQDFNVEYGGKYIGIAQNFFNNNLCHFVVERLENEEWVPASVGRDITVSKTSNDQYNFGFKVNIQRLGVYRVKQTASIQRYKYNFSKAAGLSWMDKENGGKIDGLYEYQGTPESRLYDEDTGRGIFEFICDTNTTDWDNKYLDYHGKVFSYECGKDGNCAVGKLYLDGKCVYELKKSDNAAHNGKEREVFLNKAWEYIKKNYK